MIKKAVLFSCIFILNSFLVQAQSEAKIWYFGSGAGLDFNSGNPVALTDGQMNTLEGCAVLCNESGQLLFYTDGITVWNRNHAIMLNGTGLLGHPSSTQSATIVRKPGSTTIFVVITLDARGGANGLRYSEIDLNLDGGLGGVTATKNVLLYTPSCEKLAVVKHSNNTDVWVITHGFGNTTFNSHLLTSTGFSAPIINNIGIFVPNTDTTYSMGYMKASPDGRKIAVCHNFLDAVQLFDFNSTTGILSNEQTLITVHEWYYGVEFSSNSEVLYVTSNYNNKLFQFDLTATNIPSSVITIYDFESSPGALQLGPDNKIYIALYNQNYLSSIENPEQLGAACNFQLNAVSLNGRVSQFGLPAFEQSLFFNPAIENDAPLKFIYESIEMPTAEVLLKIERNGVLIDDKKLNEQSHEIGKKILLLEEEAYQLAGQPFNLASPKQLQDILFNKLGIKSLKKTPSGAPSTDEDVLQELALDYPLPKLLLEHRSLSKLKSTYTDKLPKMINPNTGRIHTSYNQAVAITGRLASSDPNLQNIPIRTLEGRKIREAFIANKGSSILSADYSQIELRIMAHLSQDKRLLDAFKNNEDIHKSTAAEIFGCELNSVSNEQRRYAKVINFGLIYGMSVFGLSKSLGIERSAAANYIETYFARYPGVKKYMENAKLFAKDKGYVETLFGRRLWIPEINGSNGIRRAAAERAAINAPMQGTAADLIKLAMIAVDQWLSQNAHLKTKMIMQVHDELVFEVPQNEIEILQKELPRLMEGVAKLDIPLIVDIGVGLNWDAAH